MSCYEWEGGSIVLPTAAWSKFRTELIKSWNTRQLELFNVAHACLVYIKAANKGKRNVAWAEKIREYLDSHCSGLSYNEETAVHRLIYKEGKLQAPKKKDLELYPISRGTGFQVDEVSIFLDDKRREVNYRVSENNHACEHASALHITRKMWQLLGQVKWTRGTGGTITGNDEYHRESEGAGEGGNYIKSTYGPVGDQDRKHARGRW